MHNPTAPKTVLLGDISHGDYVSLALAAPGGRAEHLRRYACSSLVAFEEAVDNFLADEGQPPLAGAAFSMSGWGVDGEVDLIHYRFDVRRESLQTMLGLSQVRIVNNFVAKALAIPLLQADDHVTVCGGAPRSEQAMAIIGPTMGFGGALLIPDGMGRRIASHCEGGHADFTPGNALEIEILKLLMMKYGQVSRERALSIPGIADLWQCLATMDGDMTPAPEAQEIVAMAWAQDARSQQVIRIQTEIFGMTASDFALIMGVRGGIYLSGDWLDLVGDLFDHDIFASRFYPKGRATSYLQDIPVLQITAPEIELLGLSTLFDTGAPNDS